MESWLTVLTLLVVGLVLVIIELIFIPGTTIVGILGFIFSLVGVYLGFSYFGDQTGWIILASAAVVTIGTVVYSFRSGAWERYSLKSAIQSKVNEGLHDNLKAGQEGISISVLRPFGKAEFDGKEFEVTTIGNYIESGSPVRITKVATNKIFVELIT